MGARLRGFARGKIMEGEPMTLHHRRFLCLVAATAALSIVPAFAQSQTYPTRTVRVIVPLSAGSATDFLTRQIAQKMSEDWGQPVVVENHPGAGITLGADMVAKSAPDGYTLLVTSASFAASAAIYSKLPYDPLKDFAPVAQIATAPFVLVASPSLRAKSVTELVALAKGKPGEIKYGSAGIGTSSHFAAEQFKLASGINIAHVPYKGPAQALADLAPGHVDISWAPLLLALPYIKEGKLQALGVTTLQRSPMLLDVPTIAEAGLPGYEYQDWWGVFAPAGTPPAVTNRISKQIARAVELPDIAKQLLSKGVEARASKPDDFTGFVRTNVETVRQVAKSAGIQPQ
jgi:tripartite-type tricarboxylate transporter receptor subunit TctC